MMKKGGEEGITPRVGLRSNKKSLGRIYLGK